MLIILPPTALKQRWIPCIWLFENLWHLLGLDHTDLTESFTAWTEKKCWYSSSCIIYISPAGVLGESVSTGRDPHLLHTLSLPRLLLCGGHSINVIDVSKVVAYVQSPQKGDHYFAGGIWGESDTIFSFFFRTPWTPIPRDSWTPWIPDSLGLLDTCTHTHIHN